MFFAFKSIITFQIFASIYIQVNFATVTEKNSVSHLGTLIVTLHEKLASIVWSKAKVNIMHHLGEIWLLRNYQCKL